MSSDPETGDLKTVTSLLSTRVSPAFLPCRGSLGTSQSATSAEGTTETDSEELEREVACVIPTSRAPLLKPGEDAHERTCEDAPIVVRGYYVLPEDPERHKTTEDSLPLLPALHTSEEPVSPAITQEVACVIPTSRAPLLKPGEDAHERTCEDAPIVVRGYYVLPEDPERHKTTEDPLPLLPALHTSEEPVSPAITQERGPVRRARSRSCMRTGAEEAGGEAQRHHSREP
ncbi:hypothetical protein MRX96_042208 [Rhipicephalus microplus]